MLSLSDLYVIEPTVVARLKHYAGYHQGGGWQSACSKAVADQLMTPGEVWRRERRARLIQLRALIETELKRPEYQ